MPALPVIMAMEHVMLTLVIVPVHLGTAACSVHKVSQDHRTGMFVSATRLLCLIFKLELQSTCAAVDVRRLILLAVMLSSLTRRMFSCFDPSCLPGRTSVCPSFFLHMKEGQ